MTPERPAPTPTPTDPLATAASAAARGARAVPPFSPARLDGQLIVDGLARWSMLLVVLAYFFITSVVRGLDEETSTLASLPMLAVLAAWVWMGVIDSRVGQRLVQITALLDQDLPSAETLLAMTLRRAPLRRTTRLTLYHRLAMLRHRQRRYAECATICDSVLAHRIGAGSLAARTIAAAAPRSVVAPGGTGPQTRVRHHLLLMLAESQLHTDQIAGAYDTLAELHDAPLNLIESLQRLALQTRYELEAGRPQAALAGLEEKIRLAELMPAPQAGAVHAMLGMAAERLGETRAARWLVYRAKLLATDEQLKAAV